MSTSNTFKLAGEITINRMGFGAMRICGPGIWGHPADTAAAKALCRQALDLGVNFIDTADAYGPEVSEYLLAEALYPYPEELVIATKGGLSRGGPNDWVTDGRPENLRRRCHNSLRRLRLDTIDLYQLHAVDDDVPFAESVGALARLQQEGKIRHVGLSNVTVAQIEEARGIVPIASVQNRFNLGDRAHESVANYCDANGIGFIPWYPLSAGSLAHEGGVAAEIAATHGITVGQVALAWLMHLSPVQLPIPGTSNPAHLAQNCAAASVTLSDEDMRRLNG